MTRQQVDGFYVGFDGFLDAWEFLVIDNELLLPALDVLASEFQAASPAQQVVIAAGTVDGEVLNGGAEQLFFNNAASMTIIVEKVSALGWHDLGQKLREEYRRAFAPDAKLDILEINGRAQKLIQQGGSHEQAWEGFTRLYDELDCAAFNDWYCAMETQGELGRRILSFIRANERELVNILD